MTSKKYTIITFSPVQGFIEKSRKLRDLYGSSYLLSYLSWIVCNAAKNHDYEVVSPALINITQGMPNQIIIKGDFREEDAKAAFLTAWKCITETCREWIEDNIKGEWQYTTWKRSWGLWTKYAWEFFWVQGKENQSISDVREKLNQRKRSRDWTGINWQGESSTLSGADAIGKPCCFQQIAHPKLGEISDPRKYNYQQEKQLVTAFYQALSEKLGESFIDPKEELSIPELIKRLITYESVSNKLIEKIKEKFSQDTTTLEPLIEEIAQISKDLQPSSFKDLHRHKDYSQTQQDKGFQGWFHGDGDKAGDYLKKYPEKTHTFSKEMREWGKWFKARPLKMGRVIYAGGDDFLGIFYDKEDSGVKLEPKYCVDWFSDFKSKIWGDKKITVSVGFVWAFPGIPQRDVLQHCWDAEKSAKKNGRDRIALRILFNNGNHLEWVCPWWLLEAGLLSNYWDRDKNESKPQQNWTHIYNDVAVLESRHAFDDDGVDIALSLLKIYFPKHVNVVKNNLLHSEYADLTKTKAGILGEDTIYQKENSQQIDQTKVNKALTNWIINLAKVGFHLCQQ
ncbi:CRISPR-associated protein [Aetokthonos hydrillicola Thurmond2011]|jgi:CRISPR-associated protein Cmr2|uniref:CRISPR-associated protein n=1 Tax=Aetokthonos hydrillicola Thurmond2011 TaxID=2712845 RepID=A0AAP5IA19_9CYAN|nr:type III-B CRISPR-associated protein Cas10/Cmr2 [Aetokthonos hydrillicola]MBO3460360.1 CRISPR-associated protein [Aetokthonos hydrillicola CCALA 1050]MBW4588374.1 CRISPR-associated protein [Aetokthonos hydrillicola CCALA 1050]MDR9896484.1 CRISPR-associated protein [Aetokthonos hydrillicola Thurmond2011]